MDDSKKLPAFQAVTKPTHFKSPEDLFGKLAGRAQSHAYLRGPQQDVLREYEKHVNSSNVAAELPTGTGKTAVGLLIAEWHRRMGKRVAFLSLTNQLAGQVLEESRSLNLPCADLRGKKDDRSATEEGRFRTRSAIGVSTYSNLFNVKPVIGECDLLVLDDAHGAEQHVADMWTVAVRKTDDAQLFKSLLTDLRPGLSESQLHAILDPSGFRTIDMVDVLGHPESLVALAATLDKVETPSVRFPWRQVRNRLPVCVFLVSSSEIVIRPVIPPTHTHAPFASAAQRLYLSATLGGESDLRRAYGIDKVSVVRAKSQQWGRRYVFVPGAYLNIDEAASVVARVWDSITPRRAVLLAPSERGLTKAYKAITKEMQTPPSKFGATDIQDSLDTFVTHNAGLLALASRYDGLDLPGDQCRLLIMADSPSATNALEQCLSERWKLGPVLRKRERTRLIQGMGRCTRNATDFAVIIWIGQSLVNAATSQALLAGMPPELAAEIRWGLAQVEAAQKTSDICDMIVGLLGSADYRQAADTSIDESTPAGQFEESLQDYERVGLDEVYFARAMWDEDYGRSFELAHGIADQVTAPELAGYRAWWWFLASLAATLANNAAGARDALQRGAACGVNAGWLRRIALYRGAAAITAADSSSGSELNAEAIWELLDNWGWAGPEFASHVSKMLGLLADQAHAGYHEGLELLGKCVGASCLRTTEPGAPDVVWSFPGDTHFGFEAKTEKKVGTKLSKKELQEAKGHVDWIRSRMADGSNALGITPVLVAPDSAVHEIGEPFAGGLYYVAPAEILGFARQIAEHLGQLRLKYSGRDYSSAQKELSADIRAAKMDMGGVMNLLTKTPLGT